MNLFVFIDTNIWLLPHLNKIDVFSELDKLLINEQQYDLVVSRGVMLELTNISRNKNLKESERTGARIGLKLIEKADNKITIMNSSEEDYVDDFIIKLAKKYKENFILVTNDRKLRKKIKEKVKKCRIIGMRKKSRLDFLFLFLLLSLLPPLSPNLFSPLSK